MTKAHKCALS